MGLQSIGGNTEECRENTMQEHEIIMEEAERHDRLEYNDDEGSEVDEGEDSDGEEDESESNVEL